MMKAVSRHIKLEENEKSLTSSCFAAMTAMLAHMSCSGGKNPRSTLGHLVKATRLSPMEPVLWLSLGVTYLALTAQRTTPNRHVQFINGIACVRKCMSLRGTNTTEAQYNLGRAYHQFGLFHLAVECYECVLRIYDNNIDEEMSKWTIPFHRHAAFNLYQIYMLVGSNHVAKLVLYKYLRL